MFTSEKCHFRNLKVMGNESHRYITGMRTVCVLHLIKMSQGIYSSGKK